MATTAVRLMGKRQETINRNSHGTKCHRASSTEVCIWHFRREFARAAGVRIYVATLCVYRWLTSYSSRGHSCSWDTRSACGQCVVQAPNHCVWNRTCEAFGDMDAATATNIHALPDEVLLLVFAYLPQAGEKCAVREVPAPSCGS